MKKEDELFPKGFCGDEDLTQEDYKTIKKCKKKMEWAIRRKIKRMSDRELLEAIALSLGI